MQEVAVAGEDHGHLPFIGGGDHILILHGAAGLDGGGGTGVGGRP
jgi:hypothetical protein